MVTPVAGGMIQFGNPQPILSVVFFKVTPVRLRAQKVWKDWIALTI